MTQEEKLLLLEDLGSRLMYGVIVDYKDDEYDRHKWKITTLFAPAYSQDGTLINTDHEGWIGYDDYKGCGMSSGSRPLHLEKNLPFLRLWTSLTEKEIKEIQTILGDAIVGTEMDTISILGTQVLFKYLNKKMIDYRGLIEKGLAKAAPEGMYNN